MLNEASAVIDGSGTIDLEGGLISTQASTRFPGGILAKGLFMAGTDTTGGILDLAGTGSIPGSSSIVFAISTAAPSTLRFDLAGTVVSTEEITIDNANQTLEVGRFATLDINARENVIGGTIKMSGGTLTDNLGINFGNCNSGGFLRGFGTVAGRLSTTLGQRSQHHPGDRRQSHFDRHHRKGRRAGIRYRRHRGICFATRWKRQPRKHLYLPGSRR